MNAASTNSPDSGDWTSPLTHPLMLRRRPASAAPSRSTVHYICTFLPSAFIQPISDVVAKAPSETPMAQHPLPSPPAVALAAHILASEVFADAAKVAEPDSPPSEDASPLVAAASHASTPQKAAAAAPSAPSSVRPIETKPARAELSTRVDQLVGALSRFNRQVSALARDEEPRYEASAATVDAVWEASDILKNVENMRVALRKFEARERTSVESVAVH